MGHICKHIFPENILVRPMRPMKNVIFAEERWAKREEPAPKKADTSNYYQTNKPNLILDRLLRQGNNLMIYNKIEIKRYISEKLITIIVTLVTVS